MSDLLDMFDAWEPLVKARKAKGLHQWNKLQHISHKLEGKQAHHISFTCAHPGHGDVIVIHNLGSVEGNLHFLMGYGNPAFYMLPYHWQVVDPNLTDEEAEQVFKAVGHPSRPELWSKLSLEVRDEGEVEDGDPHPDVAKIRKLAHRDKLKQGGLKAKSKFGKYVAVPSEGLVYGLHNSHVYKWELIRDTYFAAENPNVAAAMELSEDEMSANADSVEKSAYPDIIVSLSQSRSGPFSFDVYSLVKSKFPVPGSILLSQDNIFGIVGHSDVSFYDSNGERVGIQAFDRVLTSIDLRKSGDTHPSVVYNLAKSIGINLAGLEDFVRVNQDILPLATSVPSKVLGDPSPGFDQLPAGESNFKKSVQIEGNLFKLIAESP